MTKLGDLYTEFSRIDLDTRGGYARVAKVTTQGQNGYPEHCAFKIMRHEIDFLKGMERFEDELRMLSNIINDGEAPIAITRFYDSGFISLDLSQSLYKREVPNPELEIISAGTDLQKFLKLKTELCEKDVGHWLPYLTVELAPFDDSLLRQVRQQPVEDTYGLFRLPTGEVISMALQLLDVMDYIHSKHQRVYMDWKPEHIFWNGLSRKVKLIDWNVTISLGEGPGERQNIRDDLRLFCGAVMYIGLTFVDPEDPSLPIGPHPTTEIMSPVPEIRHRYWTDNPKFYQRGVMLDEKIKQIISRGLNPNHGFNSTDELRTALMEYAYQELGFGEGDRLFVSVVNNNPYLQALAEIRLAQQNFLSAQQHLMDAAETQGETLEFTRLSRAIKRTLVNFPIS
jgi:serine/threonine protein kinase